MEAATCQLPLGTNSRHMYTDGLMSGSVGWHLWVLKSETLRDISGSVVLSCGFIKEQALNQARRRLSLPEASRDQFS